MAPRNETDQPDALTFFFDPGCPWTWITSRWFVATTERRGIPVRWRAFSLACINEDKELPGAVAERMHQSQRALRVIESLGAEGRHRDAGNFYTQVGTRVHVGGESLGDDVLSKAGHAAGIADVDGRADDASVDPVIRAAYDEIHGVLGSDVGSPAIRLDSTGTALFGPVLNPAPADPDLADRVLDATLTLLEVPNFFELKRSRNAGPDFG